LASEINNNNRSIYNLPYQYTIKAKAMFGRKIMRYKQWEMDHISTFIQTHANGGATLGYGLFYRPYCGNIIKSFWSQSDSW